MNIINKEYLNKYLKDNICNDMIVSNTLREDPYNIKYWYQYDNTIQDLVNILLEWPHSLVNQFIEKINTKKQQEKDRLKWLTFLVSIPLDIYLELLNELGMYDSHTDSEDALTWACKQLSVLPEYQQNNLINELRLKIL